VTNVFDELKWRGLVYDHTEGVAETLGRDKVTVYNGFDPTADSLHIGHLVPMMVLARPEHLHKESIAIAPLQDFLGLDSSARLNTPGRAEGNWRWRVTQAEIDASDTDYIGHWASETGRS